MADPVQPEVDDLMPLLMASRAAFAQAFNALATSRPGALPRFELIAQKRQRARAQGRLEAPEPAGDRDRNDMRAALEAAREKLLLGEFAAMAGTSVFRVARDTPLHTAALVTTDAGADPATSESAKVVYHAITSAEPFRDPAAVVDGLLRAQRRTCRVVVKGQGRPISGTGFLVGPRLVLTNWHVVKDLLDGPAVVAVDGSPAGGIWKALPGSASQLHVEFDFTLQTAVSGGLRRVDASPDWLVAASPAEGGEHQGHDGAFAWPDDTSAFEYSEDFAVIELSEPAGLERGFYDITSRPPGSARGGMILLHHPGEFSIRLSFGTFDVDARYGDLLGTPPTPARKLHDANAIGGSSGGLCLNWDMTPVALHQAGIEFGQPSGLLDPEGRPQRRSSVNVSVPLDRISSRAGDSIRKRMGEILSLPYAVDGGDPLIGRIPLQGAISRAIAGEVKIILIRADYDIDYKPHSKVGKSFSLRILRRLLGEPGLHQVVAVSAADLAPEAEGTAAAILGAVNGVAQRATERDPTNDRQSTETVDVVARIATRLGDDLVRAAGGRTLWIVIDDLEMHPLAKGSGRDLLDRLYAEVAARRELRLILVGLADIDLPSLQKIGAKFVEPPLNHLDNVAVGEWIAARVEGKFTMDGKARDVLAGVVTSVARRRVNASLSMSGSVASVVRHDLDPHLR